MEGILPPAYHMVNSSNTQLKQHKEIYHLHNKQSNWYTANKERGREKEIREREREREAKENTKKRKTKGIQDNI